MKYRIVERKDNDGKPYYKVQQKFLFFWMGFMMDKVIRLSSGESTVNQYFYQFDSKERAEAALKRSMQWGEYKGFSLYPTIEDNVYYSDKLSYRNERMGWREYKIFGTYEECCAKIDRYFEERANNKHRKIFPIDI